MNTWARQDAMLALLHSKVPGAVVLGTFDMPDLSNPDRMPPVAAHLGFAGLSAGDQAGQSAILFERWEYRVMLVIPRAQQPDRDTAQALISAAISSLLGWEWRAGLEAKLAPPPRSEFDGQISIVSLAFNIPVPAAAL